MPNIIPHAFRLLPGQDLKIEIQKYIDKHKIGAGWIGTCVGSLTIYNIRFANAASGSTGNGHFEIVSLSGTVSKDGSHLHISISDGKGNTIGGHLLDGCLIYTTAEIVLLSTDWFEFSRMEDKETNFKELIIGHRLDYPF